jgi:L-aminopeptidase/D-esterase-like protein
VFKPGRRNLITDVEGVRVGHATDEAAQSGVTTLLCGKDFSAAVDVRGGGPGSRETDSLALENLVGRAHAIVLAGGSVFGLAAADGVASALSTRGVGIHLRAPHTPIPIVPCAVLHDLANPGDKNWGMDPPYRRLGVQSVDRAGEAFDLGSVGAGRGAMAGLIKGGIGSASLDLGDGLIVGALVAVNCVGSVLMPDGVSYWAWPFEINGEFGGRGAPRGPVQAIDPLPEQSRLSELGRTQVGANTTLAVIACNAELSGADCKRIAMMAQDGMARAVRPAHTPFDGDTVFALASSARPLTAGTSRALQVARIGSAGADCLSRAIARGVHAASQRA